MQPMAGARRKPSVSTSSPAPWFRRTLSPRTTSHHRRSMTRGSTPSATRCLSISPLPASTPSRRHRPSAETPARAPSSAWSIPASTWRTPTFRPTAEHASSISGTRPHALTRPATPVRPSLRTPRVSTTAPSARARRSTPPRAGRSRTAMPAVPIRATRRSASPIRRRSLWPRWTVTATARMSPVSRRGMDARLRSAHISALRRRRIW